MNKIERKKREIKRKIKIYFCLILILTSFIFALPNGLVKNVNAEPESFKLKDTFENQQVDNRIYNENTYLNESSETNVSLQYIPEYLTESYNYIGKDGYYLSYNTIGDLDKTSNVEVSNSYFPSTNMTYQNLTVFNTTAEVDYFKYNLTDEMDFTEDIENCLDYYDFNSTSTLDSNLTSTGLELKVESLENGDETKGSRIGMFYNYTKIYNAQTVTAHIYGINEGSLDVIDLVVYYNESGTIKDKSDMTPVGFSEGWYTLTVDLNLGVNDYIDYFYIEWQTGTAYIDVGDYFLVDWITVTTPMDIEKGIVKQTLDSSEYNDVLMFEFVSNSSEFDAFTNELGDTCDFKEDLEGWTGTGLGSTISLINNDYLNITEISDTNDRFGIQFLGLHNYLNKKKYYSFEVRFKLIADTLNSEKLSFKESGTYITSKQDIYMYDNQWTTLTFKIDESKWGKTSSTIILLLEGSGTTDNDQLLIDYIKLIKDDYPLESLNNGNINVTLSDDSGHSQLINQEILDNHLNYTWGNSSHYETISQFAIGKYLFYKKYGFYPSKVTITMNVNSSLYLLRLGEYLVYGENSNTRIYNKYVYTFIPNYNLFFDYSDTKGNNKKFDLDFTDLYYLDNLGNKTEFQEYKHQFISFKTTPLNKFIFHTDEFFSVSNNEKGYWGIYFNYTENLQIECVHNNFNNYIFWNFANNGTLLINNFAYSTGDMQISYNLTDTWLTLEQISFGQVYMFKHSLSGQTTFAGKYFTNITVGDYSQWHNVPLINNSISGFHDYAQEVLGDAWDFEEGDLDNWSLRRVTYAIKNGYLMMYPTGSYTYLYPIFQLGSINTNYYNYLIIRLKTNYTFDIRVEIYNAQSKWITGYDQEGNNFHNCQSFKTIIFNLNENSNWNNFENGLRINIRHKDISIMQKNESYYIDYIRLIHLDGLRFYHEDKNFGDLIDFNEGNSDADHIMVSGSTTGNINNQGYAIFSDTTLIQLYFWDDTSDNLTYIQLLDKNISLIQTRIFIEDSSTNFILYTQSSDHIYAYSYISSLKRGWNVITLPIPYMTYLEPESMWYIRIDTTNCIIDYIYTFNYETEYTYIKTDKELSLDEETITPVEEEQVFSSNKSNIIYTKLFEEEKENYLTLNITYDIYLDKSDSYIKYSSEEQLNLTYNSLNIRKYILLNNLLEKSSLEYNNYTYTLKKIYLKEFTDLRGNLTFYSGITNQSQTLTYERAYNGLYAYKNEVSDCLEFKTVIDIPHVSYFPNKIVFYSYSTNYKYELRFYIDNYYKTLKTFDAGMWIYTGERIDRSDYIINNTNSEIKFVIIAQESNVTETIDNLLIIDDLEITYTDYRYQFENSFNFLNNSGELEITDYTVKNENNYFKLDTTLRERGFSPIYEYKTSTTKDIFTRRAFMEYSLKTKSDGYMATFLNQTQMIYADKTYKIVFTVNGTEYFGSANYTTGVSVGLSVYYWNETNAKFVRYTYVYDIYQYIKLDNSLYLKIEYECVQIDYNSLSIKTYVQNGYVANDSTSVSLDLGLSINTEKIKHSFLTSDFETTLKQYYVTSVSPPNPPALDTQTFSTELSISRDIKHSEVQTIGKEKNPYQIDWDADFFDIVKQVLKVIVNFFIDSLTFFVQSLIYLKEILAEIINIKNILRSIENWIMGISQTIDEIKNIISTNGITINSILQILGEINNYIPGIAGDIGNIADTIIDVFNVLKDVYDIIINLDTSVTDMEDFITQDLLDDLEELASDIETELATYDVLDFFNFGLNLTNYWKLGDWTSFTNEYSSFFPSTETVFENIIDVALEPFYFLFGGHNVGIIISKSLSFFEQIVPFIYILLMMYMYRILKLINARDWEALKDEIETVIRIINYVFRFIWKTFDFIFRMIHAILDVAIPLT